MAALIVLTITFTASYIYLSFRKRKNLILAGNIAMSVMMVFTGISHFIYTKGMVLMIPEFVPYKGFFVYLSGSFEITVGLFLLLKDYRKITATLLIIFFVLVLPANIIASLKNLNIQTGEFNGNGPGYLWFRIPLQIFFIWWVHFFSIKKSIH